MANSSSVRRSNDEDSIPESYLLVDLENGQAPKTDSPDANDRQPGSDWHSGMMHVPDEFDESQNLLPAEETPRPKRRFGRIHAALAAVSNWAKGPNPPRPCKIEPFFAEYQTKPIGCFMDASLGIKSLFFSLTVLAWVIVFTSYLSRSSVGIPDGSPTRLSCVSRLWSSSTACGLNGERCRPFQDSSFVFRCPAGCSDAQVLEPYTIGDQEINYQSLVIGGHMDDGNSTVYRGDSFVCAAAIHAGVLSDRLGGCGVISRTGEQSNYPSVEANGLSSIGFLSNFPLSFTFDKTAASDLGLHDKCRDMRWPLLIVSVLFSSVLAIFITSPVLFFCMAYVGVYFHVALASDPPRSSGYPLLISTALGRFLPAAFVAFVIYRYCVRRTLQGLTAQYEKAILWLGGCWVGALNNYTFDQIPISRLTPHDLQQQPGAILSLIILVAVIFAIAIGQALSFRVEGRMPRYLALYAVMGAGILILALVPTMNLRIHHYILALLFLPGTSLQTRPSLLYQGILVGLFIHGIARWGFDSILQTPGELLNDGQLGSALPQVIPPSIGQDNITFAFPELVEDFDGVSVLVNDVERFHKYGADDTDPFTWTRLRDGEPEYFRFGYVKMGDLNQVWYGDFTKAGTWETNGSWVHMEPGPSR